MLFFPITQSYLPKTATGKVQKYVLRGKPAISKQ
jgi:acyl-coenzyme A synthetase/AMP-(fatty) acid ligase